MISFNIPIPTSPPTTDQNNNNNTNINTNNDNKSKFKKQQKQLSIESSLLIAAKKVTVHNTNIKTNNEQCILIIKATDRVTVSNCDKVFEINGKSSLSLSKVLLL